MVKCADCGFLTMRNDYTGQLDEMDSQFRLSGNPPRRRTGEWSTSGPAITTPYRHVPICFAREYNLIADLSPTIDDPYDMAISPELAKEIIDKSHECAAFTPWQQGFTPKEHQEMLDRAERLKQEDDLRKSVWQREEEREQRAEDWHKEEMETLKSQHKASLLIFGGLVVVLTVGGSIVGAMIGAEWIARPW